MAKHIPINLLFQANTSAAVQNITQLSQLLAKISSETVIGVNDGALARASDAARQLQVHLQNAVNVDTGKIDLSKLDNSLKTAGTNLSTLTQNLQGAGAIGQQAFIKLATAVASAEAPVVRINRRLAEMGQTLLNTAKWQLASKAIHGVEGAMSAAVQHAEELNNALSDISVVTGYSKQSMASFAEDAAKTAKALNTTTTEYAKAALIFYQQGLTGSDVTERTDVVVKLAQVTGQSAQEVSDQMTAIWNNFDDGSTSLEHYADALTKLGAATAASTDEIAEGLEKFAAIADTVGLSYETAAAAVATVVDKTRQSADVVGTSFKTIFARMEGLTLGETLDDGVNLNKYSAALQSVGIEVLNASGELRSMDDLLGELGEKWQYFGEETQIALAQTVGGIRQYNQMIALMDNWDSVQRNITLATESTGELTKQQSIWSKSYEAAAERVKKSQDELSESLFSDDLLIGLQDLFAQLIGGLAKTFDAIGGIIPLAAMLAMVFSNKLVPVLTKAAQTVYQNWRVATGRATDDIIRMQEIVKIGMTDMMNSAGLSDPMKQQILLSKDLLTAKQRLAEASKKMSDAEREEAQRRMDVYEAMIAEAQASLELQDKLQKEIDLNKQNLTSKQNRSTLASHSAANEFKEKHVDELALQDDPDDYVEGLRVEATTKTSKDIQSEAQQSAQTYSENVADITGKMSGVDASTDEGAAQLEEYRQKLEELRIAEEEQQARYKDILELQKQIGLAARKTADELKEVAVGSVDGFSMDPELEEKSGLEFASSAISKSRRADEQEAKGNVAYAENQRKGTIAKDNRRAKAATGQEMLGSVSDSLTAGADGEGFAVSLQNLETLLTKINEYKGQAAELQTIATDLNITYSGQGESISAAALALDGYEQDLAAIKTAEQEREAALRALIEAQDAAAAAGQGDVAAAKALKAAKEAASKAELNLQAAQTKASKSFKSLSKESQSYVKQLSSLRSALEKAARSSKNSAKELEKIDEIFADLKKGGEPAKKALGELQYTLQRLGGGSQEAADGMEVLAQTISEQLIDAGMDAGQIEAFIANMEKMGMISPEIASKLRQIGNSGQEMGSKIMTGGKLAMSIMTQLGTAAGQLTMAISAIQGITNAFAEGNTPLETTVALLTSMSMLLPMITGLMTTFNAIQKITATTQLAVNAAKAAGEVIDKKKIATIWAENAAESSLLIVKIIASAVEKMGFVGVAVGIALAATAIVTIVALTAAYKAKTKANLEANKAQADASAGLVEAIDKTQELANEVHNLTEEYEKLSEAGKNTTETLDKMNEKIPELIASYRGLAKEMSDDKGLQLSNMTDELEHLYNVAQLTGDFSAFNQKKAELDNYITEVEYANAMAGGQAAGSIGAKAMSDATNGSVKGNKMKLKLDGSDGAWSGLFWGDWWGEQHDNENAEETKAKDILKKQMGDYYKGGHGSSMFTKTTANLEVDYTNPAEFVQYYEKMQEAQQEMVRTMSEKQLADSDIYRELNDALEAGKEQYDKMVPMAKAQADSGGKLTEALMESTNHKMKDGSTWTAGIKMEDVDTLEEYIQYKEAFIQIATIEYGLTESQAKAYLREAEGLSRVSQEYELAAQMLENFSGVDIEHLTAEQIQDVQNAFKDTFGELSDEELSVAVSIAATATSLNDFSEKMQQALITSSRQAFEQSASIAADAMASSVENGQFSLTALYSDDNFIDYLKDIGVQQVTLTAMSYEEQYRIVSDYYSKVNSLIYDSYSAQQELHYQAVAQRQQEIAALLAKGNTSEVTQKQEEYAELKTKLSSTVDPEEKANIQSQLNDLAASFQVDYGFQIDSNLEELQNEMDNLLAQIDELQDKKIEMAMDWTGVDTVEQSMAKTAEFAKLMQKEVKQLDKNTDGMADTYVLTAKQAREWLEVYPELGEIAETTEDGLIEMNADRVKAFLEGNETELDSTIDTKIAELEAQKATLQAELELREIDFKAAQAFAQGEMQLEGVSAEYLTQLRANLTQYYMDLGMDQVEANARALETMQMNEDEYSNYVADACKNQAENIAYSAEAGANAQMNSLQQIGAKWKSFGSYLLKNIGPILLDIGAAILDPTRSVKDVMLDAWNEGTKSISVTADTSKIKDNTSTLDLKSLDKQTLDAAYNAVSQKQSEGISAKISELKDGINSLDGQIDYLNALKNQDLSDYGQEGIGTEELEKMEEARERYHELIREAEALERAVNKLSDAEARAFGADKIGLMEDQMDALEELKSKQEDLLLKKQSDQILDKLTLDELFKDTKDAKTGAAITVNADGIDGNLSNYSDLVAAAEAELNAARETYNNSKQDTDDEEALEKAEEKYEKQIAALEQYEETLDGIAESEETVLDLGNQIQDLKFDQLNTKMELQLEVNDSELEVIDYYLEKYADDFYKIAESAALIGSQMDISTSNIDIQKNYMAELDAAKANNEISDADYGEARDEVIASIRDEMLTLMDLDKEMQEYYGNTLAKAQEEIGKYTEKMGHLSGVLDHYQSMLAIIGKETDYKSMGIVLQGIADNMANQVKVAEEEYAFYKGEADKKKALMNSAINDPAAFEAYKKEWEAAEAAARTAQENMLAQTEAWAESMKSVIQNKLSDFASTLEDQLTGGTSFDEMTTSIERAASLQEEYLTTTNQIYETTKMMRTAEKALDETTSTAAKNKLKGFIETTKQLQNQGKLSQFELDTQQAKYDLLLAEIALEEAQNAKSTVRLQRDAEGNFGYVYTADANQVADAQQAVDDAENALYNKQLEGANDYAQKYQQTLAESQDAVSALTQAYFDGEIATEEEYLRRMEETKTYYQEKLQSYSDLYKVATAEDSAVVSDAWSTSFMNTAISADEWAASVSEYSASCGEAFLEWEDVVAEVEEVVGDSLTNIADNVNAITAESDALTTELTEDGGVIDALGAEVNAVSAVTDAYAKKRESIQATIRDLEAYVTELQRVANAEKGDFSDPAPDTSSSGDGENSGDAAGFDTGGYTGEWGPSGKLAVLHQKELVLNATDTANLLSVVDMIRALDMHAMSAQIGGILSTPGFHGGESGNLEQNVKIEASFPNVQDRNEIEEAFNNLINRASQYANRG